MLLSVCLITKNEERFLAGCLDSVRAAADEIVLVDTGSLDRTVEIARDYGCRVLHRAWDDDFCPLSLKASAWSMLAALLSEEGLRGAAVSCVKESLTLIPDQSLAYYVLAEVLYADGRFAHALEAYRRVRRSMDAESGPSQVLGDLCMTPGKRGYKLGCCYLALGRLTEAEGQFREGLEGDPKHGGCHYGLARAALVRGDRASALEHLQTAVKQDPTWRVPRELLAEITAEGRA